VRLVALLLLAACGQTGTLHLELVFPAGETRLPAAAATVRIAVDDPALEQIVPVAADGSFTTSLSFDAHSRGGQVTVEARDAAGAVVARGVSPPLSFDADSQIVEVLVAPPGRFSAAPFDQPARADLAVAPLSYGVLLAGGRDADGGRSDAVAIYSVYRQTLTAGAPLPGARAAAAAAATFLDIVYLYGGLGTGDAPTSDLWRFDTTVAPAGSYATIAVAGAPPRAGAAVAPLGGDRFLLTGAPPLLLDAGAGTVRPFANAPDAAGQATAAATTAASGVAIVVLAGAGGVLRYDAGADAFSVVDAAPRTGAAAATLPSGDVLVAADGDSLLVPPTGAARPGPAIPGPRRAAAAAVAGTTLVLAGGFDAAGTARADAVRVDTTTLAVDTVPLLLARGGASAVALPNRTVLVVGGRAHDGGAPVAGAEIYTP
jgi:hypothetical protein